MASAWDVPAVGWSILVVGWLISPIITFFLPSIVSYLWFDASEKLEQLEIHILPELQERMQEVDKKRMLDRGNEKRISDVATLDKMAAKLRHAREDVEDIFDDHQEIELYRNRFWQRLYGAVKACIVVGYGAVKACIIVAAMVCIAMREWIFPSDPYLDKLDHVQTELQRRLQTLSGADATHTHNVIDGLILWRREIQMRERAKLANKLLVGLYGAVATCIVTCLWIVRSGSARLLQLARNWLNEPVPMNEDQVATDEQAVQVTALSVRSRSARLLQWAHNLFKEPLQLQVNEDQAASNASAVTSSYSHVVDIVASDEEAVPVAIPLEPASFQAATPTDSASNQKAVSEATLSQLASRYEIVPEATLSDLASYEESISKDTPSKSSTDAEIVSEHTPSESASDEEIVTEAPLADLASEEKAVSEDTLSELASEDEIVLEATLSDLASDEESVSKDTPLESSSDGEIVSEDTPSESASDEEIVTEAPLADLASDEELVSEDTPSDSTSLPMIAPSCSSFDVFNNICRFILCWLVHALIGAAYFLRDWPYAMVGITNNKKNATALDFLLTAISRRNLKKRIENVESTVSEMKKSPLLGVASKIAPEDITNKNRSRIRAASTRKTFSVGDIFHEMLKDITKDRHSNISDREELEEKLKESLGGKRFLLILDDLWVETKNDLQLEELISPLNVGLKGSKILVTARTKVAAGVLCADEPMQMPDMDEDPYFSMFMHYALGGTSVDDEEFKRVGRVIARKLHGSPIAAVIVAGQLGAHPDISFWKHTAELDKLNNTMDALWWSYQQLSPNIKRCFEYCNIFPRRFEMKKGDLIHLWIAQGFVKTSCATEDMEDVAEGYIQELVSYSFLQPAEHFLFDAREEKVGKEISLELRMKAAREEKVGKEIFLEMSAICLFRIMMQN
ncbi:putative disease resistance protein RGA4 [Hordeum vulgare]|nr:putative disease resistance protein RGA4 [Hordeum vulgare]